MQWGSKLLFLLTSRRYLGSDQVLHKVSLEGISWKGNLKLSLSSWFSFSGNFSFPLNFSLGWNLRCDLHLALPTPLMGNSLNSNEMDQMIREQRWDEIILITKKGKYLHIFQIINYQIKRRWSFYSKNPVSVIFHIWFKPLQEIFSSRNSIQSAVFLF